MENRRRLSIGVGVGVAVACVLLMGVVGYIALRLMPPGERKPEGVAYNYQMVLIRRDYEKAYGYLSPALKNYPPSEEVFVQDMERAGALPEWTVDPCVYIESTSVSGTRAVVRMREYYHTSYCGWIEGGSLMFILFEMELELENGKWKVVDSDKHFPWFWVQDEPSP